MRARTVRAPARPDGWSRPQELPAVCPRPAPPFGLELRQLRYLVVLSEEHNMTRAAARLHLTQPALSQAMHNLELRLGVRMFDRLPRGIELTGPGEAFVGHARTVVAAADAAEAAAARLVAERRNQLLIAFTSGLMSIASQLVCLLRGEDDSVEISMKSMPASTLIEGLVAGMVDIGLACPELRAADVVATTAVRVPLVALISTEHGHAGDQVGSTEQIAGLKVVGPWARELTRDTVADIDQDRVGPSSEPEQTTVEEACPNILAGTSIAVVPAFLADTYAMPGVVARQLPDHVRTAIGISRRADDTRALVASVAERLAQHNPFGGDFELAD